MPRFRKKPVEIEAMHLCADNAKDVCDWMHSHIYRESAGEKSLGAVLRDDGTVLIDTLEGTMRADIGDWIIRGVKGEFYPCKPDIFEATYDPVERPLAGGFVP